MRNRKGLTTIAVLVLQAFLMQQVTFAAPVATWFETSASGQPKLHFQIPASVATITDSYLAPKQSGSRDERLIFLIQDAHTNESGQINLAKSLEHIIRGEKLEHVFLEAGQGDLSISFLRDSATIHKRRRVGMNFLRKGRLQGSEYLDLTSELDFKLWGVEDRALYEQAINAYRAVIEKRGKHKVYLKKVLSTLRALKPKLLNDGLSQFDQKREAYRKESITLTAYLTYLIGEARRAKLELRNYPNLKKLRELVNVEKRLDFQSANKEQIEAIEAFAHADQVELKQAIKRQTRSPFHFSTSGHTEDKAFYTLLDETLKRYRWHKRFPALRAYLDYLVFAQTIDPASALEEEAKLERVLIRALAENETEKRLLKYDDTLRFLERFLDLSVTSAEYRAYQADQDEYDIVRIGAFLNRQILERDDLYEKTLFLDETFHDTSRLCEKFYNLTLDRDLAFIRNLFQRLANQNQKKAVLITGGYHTENLTKLLRDRQVSYVVIAPNVLHPTDHSRYEKFLAKQILSQEDVQTARKKKYVSSMLALNQASLDQTVTEAEFRFVLGADSFKDSTLALMGARLNGKVGLDLVRQVVGSRLKSKYAEAVADQTRKPAVTPIAPLRGATVTDAIQAELSKSPLGSRAEAFAQQVRENAELLGINIEGKRVIVHVIAADVEAKRSVRTSRTKFMFNSVFEQLGADDQVVVVPIEVANPSHANTPKDQIEMDVKGIADLMKEKTLSIDVIGVFMAVTYPPELIKAQGAEIPANVEHLHINPLFMEGGHLKADNISGTGYRLWLEDHVLPRISRDETDALNDKRIVLADPHVTSRTANLALQALNEGMHVTVVRPDSNSLHQLVQDLEAAGVSDDVLRENFHRIVLDSQDELRSYIDQSDATILVNPHYGAEPGSPLIDPPFKSGQAVYDTVYQERQTVIMDQAEAGGAEAFNGTALVRYTNYALAKHFLGMLNIAVSDTDLLRAVTHAADEVVEGGVLVPHVVDAELKGWGLTQGADRQSTRVMVDKLFAPPATKWGTVPRSMIAEFSLDADGELRLDRIKGLKENPPNTPQETYRCSRVHFSLSQSGQALEITTSETSDPFVLNLRQIGPHTVVINGVPISVKTIVPRDSQPARVNLVYGGQTHPVKHGEPEFLEIGTSQVNLDDHFSEAGQRAIMLLLQDLARSAKQEGAHPIRLRVALGKTLLFRNKDIDHSHVALSSQAEQTITLPGHLADELFSNPDQRTTSLRRRIMKGLFSTNWTNAGLLASPEARPKSLSEEIQMGRTRFTQDALTAITTPLAKRLARHYDEEAERLGQPSHVGTPGHEEHQLEQAGIELQTNFDSGFEQSQTILGMTLNRAQEVHEVLQALDAILPKIYYQRGNRLLAQFAEARNIGFNPNKTLFVTHLLPPEAYTGSASIHPVTGHEIWGGSSTYRIYNGVVNALMKKAISMRDSIPDKHSTQYAAAQAVVERLNNFLRLIPVSVDNRYLLDEWLAYMTYHPYVTGSVVSAPYKAQVADLLDLVSDLERYVGVDPIVKITLPDGTVQLVGKNNLGTLADWINDTVRLVRGANVLVIGGGASGATVAWRLRQLGANVTIMGRETADGNKTLESMRDFFKAHQTGVSDSRLDFVMHTDDADAYSLARKDAILNSTIIIDATGKGKESIRPEDEKQSPLSTAEHQAIKKGTLVVSMLYRPQWPYVLELSKKPGVEAHNGAGYLVYINYAHFTDFVGQTPFAINNETARVNKERAQVFSQIVHTLRQGDKDGQLSDALDILENFRTSVVTEPVPFYLDAGHIIGEMYRQVFTVVTSKPAGARATLASKLDEFSFPESTAIQTALERVRTFVEDNNILDLSTDEIWWRDDLPHENELRRPWRALTEAVFIGDVNGVTTALQALEAALDYRQAYLNLRSGMDKEEPLVIQLRGTAATSVERGRPPQVRVIFQHTSTGDEIVVTPDDEAVELILHEGVDILDLIVPLELSQIELAPGANIYNYRTVAQVSFDSGENWLSSLPANRTNESQTKGAVVVVPQSYRIPDPEGVLESRMRMFPQGQRERITNSVMAQLDGKGLLGDTSEMHRAHMQASLYSLLRTVQRTGAIVASEDGNPRYRYFSNWLRDGWKAAQFFLRLYQLTGVPELRQIVDQHFQFILTSDAMRIAHAQRLNPLGYALYDPTDQRMAANFEITGHAPRQGEDGIWGNQDDGPAHALRAALDFIPNLEATDVTNRDDLSRFIKHNLTAIIDSLTVSYDDLWEEIQAEGHLYTVLLQMDVLMDVQDLPGDLVSERLKKDAQTALRRLQGLFNSRAFQILADTEDTQHSLRAHIGPARDSVARKIAQRKPDNLDSSTIGGFRHMSARNREAIISDVGGYGFIFGTMGQLDQNFRGLFPINQVANLRDNGVVFWGRYGVPENQTEGTPERADVFNGDPLSVFINTEGNPWTINSFWRVQELIAIANDVRSKNLVLNDHAFTAFYQALTGTDTVPADSDQAADRQIQIAQASMDTVMSFVREPGLITEQLDRYSGAERSVRPLGWAQWEYFDTMLQLASPDARPRGAQSVRKAGARTFRTYNLDEAEVTSSQQYADVIVQGMDSERYRQELRPLLQGTSEEFVQNLAEIRRLLAEIIPIYGSEGGQLSANPRYGESNRISVTDHSLEILKKAHALARQDFSDEPSGWNHQNDGWDPRENLGLASNYAQILPQGDDAASARLRELFNLEVILHDVAINAQHFREPGPRHAQRGAIVTQRVLTALGDFTDQDIDLVSFMVASHTDFGTLYLRERHPAVILDNVQDQIADPQQRDAALELLALHTLAEVRTLMNPAIQKGAFIPNSSKFSHQLQTMSVQRIEGLLAGFGSSWGTLKSLLDPEVAEKLERVGHGYSWAFDRIHFAACDRHGVLNEERYRAIARRLSQVGDSELDQILEALGSPERGYRSFEYAYEIWQGLTPAAFVRWAFFIAQINATVVNVAERFHSLSFTVPTQDAPRTAPEIERILMSNSWASMRPSDWDFNRDVHTHTQSALGKLEKSLGVTRRSDGTIRWNNQPALKTRIERDAGERDAAAIEDDMRRMLAQLNTGSGEFYGLQVIAMRTNGTFPHASRDIAQAVRTGLVIRIPTDGMTEYKLTESGLAFLGQAADTQVSASSPTETYEVQKRRMISDIIRELVVLRVPLDQIYRALISIDPEPWKQRKRYVVRAQHVESFLASVWPALPDGASGRQRKRATAQRKRAAELVKSLLEQSFFQKGGLIAAPERQAFFDAIWEGLRQETRLTVVRNTVSDILEPHRKTDRTITVGVTELRPAEREIDDLQFQAAWRSGPAKVVSSLIYQTVRTMARPFKVHAGQGVEHKDAIDQWGILASSIALGDAGVPVQLRNRQHPELNQLEAPTQTRFGNWDGESNVSVAVVDAVDGTSEAANGANNAIVLATVEEFPASEVEALPAVVEGWSLSFAYGGEAQGIDIEFPNAEDPQDEQIMLQVDRIIERAGLQNEPARVRVHIGDAKHFDGIEKAMQERGFQVMRNSAGDYEQRQVDAISVGQLDLMMGQGWKEVHTTAMQAFLRGNVHVRARYASKVALKQDGVADMSNWSQYSEGDQQAHTEAQSPIERVLDSNTDFALERNPFFVAVALTDGDFVPVEDMVAPSEARSDRIPGIRYEGDTATVTARVVDLTGRMYLITAQASMHDDNWYVDKEPIGARRFSPEVEVKILDAETHVIGALQATRQTLLEARSDLRIGKTIEHDLKPQADGVEDIVTSVDLKVQLELLQTLERTLPFAFRVIAEEDQGPAGEIVRRLNEANADSPWTIVLDAIDGTHPFFKDTSNPYYSTLLSIRYNNETVASYILAPEFQLAPKVLLPQRREEPFRGQRVARGGNYGALFYGNIVNGEAKVAWGYDPDIRGYENLYVARLDKNIRRDLKGSTVRSFVRDTEFLKSLGESFQIDDGLEHRRSTGLVMAEVALGFMGGYAAFIDIQGEDLRVMQKQSMVYDVDAAMFWARLAGYAVLNWDGEDLVLSSESNEVPGGMVLAPPELARRIVNARKSTGARAQIFSPFMTDGPPRHDPNFFPETYKPDEREAELLARAQKFVLERVRPNDEAIERRSSDKVAHSDQRGEGKLADGWPSEILRELTREAAELGIVGAAIPEQHGGTGVSKTVRSQMTAFAYKGNPSWALTVDVTQALAPLYIVLLGSDAQKQVLPSIASAERIAALTLTEPKHGSDVFNRDTVLETQATLQADGTYLISGPKKFITNGGFADVFVVLASVGNTSQKAFFLIDGREHVATEHVFTKMAGLEGTSLAQIRFSQAPATLLGTIEDGIKMGQVLMNSGRISIAANAKGLGDDIFEDSLNYAALERAQFGDARPLTEWGAVQEKLASLAVDHYAQETLLHVASAAWDALNDSEILDPSTTVFEATIAKVWNSTALTERMSRHATQLHGGEGFVWGRRVGRRVAAGVPTSIYEGANEILLSQVIGSNVVKQFAALGERKQRFLQNWQEGSPDQPFARAKRAVKQAVSLVAGVGQNLSEVPKTRTNQSRFMALGSMVTELYAILAVINRTENRISEGLPSELEQDLTFLLIQEGLDRIYQTLRDNEEILGPVRDAQRIVVLPDGVDVVSLKHRISDRLMDQIERDAEREDNVGSRIKHVQDTTLTIIETALQALNDYQPAIPQHKPTEADLNSAIAVLLRSLESEGNHDHVRLNLLVKPTSAELSEYIRTTQLTAREAAYNTLLVLEPEALMIVKAIARDVMQFSHRTSAREALATYIEAYRAPGARSQQEIQADARRFLREILEADGTFWAVAISGLLQSLWPFKAESFKYIKGKNFITQINKEPRRFKLTDEGRAFLESETGARIVPEQEAPLRSRIGGYLWKLVNLVPLVHAAPLEVENTHVVRLADATVQGSVLTYRSSDYVGNGQWDEPSQYTFRALDRLNTSPRVAAVQALPVTGLLSGSSSLKPHDIRRAYDQDVRDMLRSVSPDLAMVSAPLNLNFELSELNALEAPGARAKLAEIMTAALVYARIAKGRQLDVKVTLHGASTLAPELQTLLADLMREARRTSIITLAPANWTDETSGRVEIWITSRFENTRQGARNVNIGLDISADSLSKFPQAMLLGTAVSANVASVAPSGTPVLNWSAGVSNTTVAAYRRFSGASAVDSDAVTAAARATSESLWAKLRGTLLTAVLNATLRARETALRMIRSAA